MFDAYDILIQLTSVLPVKSHSYVGNDVKQIQQANIGLLCQVVTTLFVDHSDIATKTFQGMARKITISNHLHMNKDMKLQHI